MNITYQNETGLGMMELLGEIQTSVSNGGDMAALFNDHWQEIATHKSLFKLDPDYARYTSLVEHGKLICVSARDDRKIIGYIVILVDKHAHYKEVLVSLEDIHFIKPDYRHKGIGRGMIQEAERVLTAKGVKFATMRVKLHSDHGALLKELGYEPLEMIYAKTLGD